MARFYRRRKYCRFTAEGVTEIDYKDIETLKAYISETGKIVRNPKRPIFNFASQFASQEKNQFDTFSNFKKNWFVTNDLFNLFLEELDKDSLVVNLDSISLDDKYIRNTIKSEIAGSIWGKNEAANIRLQLDNQVIEALKHFNEADAFLDWLN